MFDCSNTNTNTITNADTNMNTNTDLNTIDNKSYGEYQEKLQQQQDLMLQNRKKEGASFCIRIKM